MKTKTLTMTGISVRNYILASVVFLFFLPAATGAIAVDEKIQITSGANQNAPAWSPDGSRIVYASDQAIWIINADGSGPKEIYDSVVWDGEPCFNVDGTGIYFASESSYPQFLSIHIMGSDGKDRVQLTENADQRAPAVSLDGRSVAYLSKKSGNYDIWIMDPDGSNSVRLTDAPSNEGAPSWSPDGTTIVYSSDGNIRTINRDGIHQKQLTDDEFDNIDPVFSPDGTKIAFVSDRSGNYDIWLMNSDGTGALQLTRDESVQKQPAWSPAGKRIAYVSNEGGDYNIWVMFLSDTGSQIEYTPTEVEAPTVTEEVSTIEKMIKEHSLLLGAAAIVGAVLLVVIIVRLVIRSL